MGVVNKRDITCKCPGFMTNLAILQSNLANLGSKMLVKAAVVRETVALTNQRHCPFIPNAPGTALTAAYKAAGADASMHRPTHKFQMMPTARLLTHLSFRPFFCASGCLRQIFRT
eukprot:1010214-Amphidinium_carterae.1